MSVIKNDENTNITENRNDKSTYVIPAVIRKDQEPYAFEKAVIYAGSVHIVLFLLIMITSMVFNALGIKFEKPKEEPKDIEFVLVEKEAPPIDKNTKNRADINSRAGGINDPNRPVSLPQTSAPKSPAKKPTPPAPKKQEVQKPQKKVEQPKVQQPKKTQQSKPPQPSSVVEKTTPAPKAPAPRPTPTPAVPRPTKNPNSNFNIPIPKSSIPQIAQPTTAPVTSSPTAGSSSGANGGKGSSSPAPSFSPTTSGKSGNGTGGTGTGAGGGGRFSNGTGSGQGNVGNPGPGNPKGAPGIDAIKQPDFGPYMKELQRRIKMNWDPPKGNESKRVVLLFSIARDGRLLNVSVHKSSGLATADKAALDAVKLTAPFRPLPPDFKGDKVDIQFTFDYNVFGVSY
jgi:TonB family protein